MASFLGLEVELVLLASVLLVLLASAFSLVQGSSSDQAAFQVFASFLEGPSEEAFAFWIHLALFAWVHVAFSFLDRSFPLDLGVLVSWGLPLVPWDC